MLPQIIQRHAAQTPDKIAIILRTPEGEQPLTYQQLLAGAAAYTARYRAAGLRPGDIVIDLLPPGADLLYAFLGAMLMGAVPSILPFPTPKLDPERYRASLRSLVDLTHPAAFVAEEKLKKDLEQTFTARNGLKAIFTPDDPAPADPGGSPPADPEQIAVLQHSSGTTGLQKGVALSHRAILNQLHACHPALNLTPQDVVVSWLPLYHDMGLIAGFLLPLLAGVKLVLMSPFDWVRAPWMLMQAVSQHRGTLTWLPNFAYNFCAQKIPAHTLEGVDLSSWRAVINCSEPMYAESHRLFAERFAPYGLPPDALKTCYAMAENVFAVTQGGIHAPVNIDRVDAEQLEKHRRATPVGAPAATPAAEGGRAVEVVSAGPPLPNCRVRIQADDGQPLGERSVGEIALQSDCMLTGYYHRPDATAKAMQNGWYRTGDLGYLAGGEVYITGRKKDLMIIGGKNVYPQDIEYLINKIPGIHPGRVVVFSVPNPKMGTEDAVAIAEKVPDHPISPGRLGLEIRKAVTAGADIALRHVKLVDARWLIKTSSGKIARAANREKFLAEASRNRVS